MGTHVLVSPQIKINLLVVLSCSRYKPLTGEREREREQKHVVVVLRYGLHRTLRSAHRKVARNKHFLTTPRLARPVVRVVGCGWCVLYDGDDDEGGYIMNDRENTSRHVSFTRFGSCAIQVHESSAMLGSQFVILV